MIQTTNSGQLDADLEQKQSINSRDTFKGHCCLCLAFSGVLGQIEKIDLYHVDQREKLKGLDVHYLA